MPASNSRVIRHFPTTSRNLLVRYLDNCGDMVLSCVASMLKENPKSRPNIYQVLREACLMQGLAVPIKDVGQYPSLGGPILIRSDLCWANTIRIKTKSTASQDRGNCVTTTCWGCIFPTSTCSTSHSRYCTDETRKAYSKFTAACS